MSTQLPLVPGANRSDQYIPVSTCEFGNHPIKSFTGYFYRDEAHGIPIEIRVCPACFAKHILEYYPDGRLAEHIRTHPDDYKLEPQS